MTSASTSDQAAAHYWGKFWFVALFVLFAVLVLAGAYVVCAGAIDWLPPRSWSEADKPRDAEPSGPPAPPEPQRAPRLAPPRAARARPYVARTEPAALEPEVLGRLDEFVDETRAQVVRSFDPDAAVEIEPGYLVRMFRSYTAIQAQKLFEADVDKCTEVSGPLEDVTPGDDHVFVAVKRYDDAGDARILYRLFLVFPPTAAPARNDPEGLRDPSKG